MGIWKDSSQTHARKCLFAEYAQFHMVVFINRRLEKSLKSLGVPAGASLTVALSGGADSVALTRLLHQLAPHYPLVLGAAHFNHGLRPDAAEDEAWGLDFCAGLGLPCLTDRAQSAPAPGESLHDWARNARWGFLEEARENLKADFLVLAHHRDDLIETALRLVQGAGPGGLTGLRARRGHVLRPLLAVPKSDLLAWLRNHQQTWREDTSNADHRFLRNRLRGVVLPVLEQAFPGSAAPMARSLSLLAEENEAVEEWLRLTLPDCQTPEGHLNLNHLTDKLPPALAARALIWFLNDRGVRATAAQAKEVLAIHHRRRNGQGTGHHHVGFLPGPPMLIDHEGILRPVP